MHHIEKWTDLFKSFDEGFETRNSHTSVLKNCAKFKEVAKLSYKRDSGSDVSL